MEGVSLYGQQVAMSDTPLPAPTGVYRAPRRSLLQRLGGVF
jgi:hypothetical protein